MPLLDVMNATEEWTLGYKLRHLAYCIFVDVKSQLLDVRTLAYLGNWPSPTQPQTPCHPCLLVCDRLVPYMSGLHCTVMAAPQQQGSEHQ